MKIAMIRSRYAHEHYQRSECFVRVGVWENYDECLAELEKESSKWRLINLREVKLEKNFEDAVFALPQEQLSKLLREAMLLGPDVRNVVRYI